jgi:hypothetical protein
MERIEKTVFISYRRRNLPWTLAIFQNLEHSGYDVFFDYTGIASGDFERVILGNIVARAHFLVLLTPSALERCHEPGDWLRREIESALDNRRNVVPLMLEGFNFEAPEISSQLTGRLAALQKYNGLPIPSEFFMEAMDRLRQRYLNVLLTAVLHPMSESQQIATTDQKVAADTAPPIQQRDLTRIDWYRVAKIVLIKIHANVKTQGALPDGLSEDDIFQTVMVAFLGSENHLNWDPRKVKEGLSVEEGLTMFLISLAEIKMQDIRRGYSRLHGSILG